MQQSKIKGSGQETAEDDGGMVWWGERTSSLSDLTQRLGKLR
jgi:hypothetical protein